MDGPISPAAVLDFADGEKTLAEAVARLKDGRLVPFLGPGLIDQETTLVPMTPEALAAFFATKVALPRRARGNAWASAQHIESTRHRNTVTTLMTEAFAPAVEPTPLHRYLAGLGLPMIVDSWYDDTLRTALAGQTGWGEVQGITRAGINENIWFRYYDAAGQEVDADAAAGWTTLLYKPHGGKSPAGNFLISDADYVEVLTEIDIQSPIPDPVKDRRATASFLFLGCRFHDQLLRTYARQVSKRSEGPNFAVVDPDLMTKNEVKFLVEQGIRPIALPLGQVAGILLAGA